MERKPINNKLDECHLNYIDRGLVTTPDIQLLVLYQYNFDLIDTHNTQAGLLSNKKENEKRHDGTETKIATGKKTQY